MTPDEFQETVLPQILSAWEEHCFCACPGFRKLLSFDFRDYNIGPTALADSEILIDAIIGNRFIQRQEQRSHQDESTHTRICPQCHAVGTVLYAEFSISMYHSKFTFEDATTASPMGLFLVGFRGFKGDDFDRIHDFQQVTSVSEFIRHVTTA